MLSTGVVRTGPLKPVTNMHLAKARGTGSHRHRERRRRKVSGVVRARMFALRILVPNVSKHRADFWSAAAESDPERKEKEEGQKMPFAFYSIPLFSSVSGLRSMQFV